MNPRTKKPTALKRSSLEIISRKGLFKLLLKTAVTVLAGYIVISKIDLNETWDIILSADPVWLFMALVCFNVSKWISAFRLNIFFRMAGLDLSTRYNLILYYVGMFYNLFLPGGIGGDGYKVYLLNRNFKIPVKHLIGATLLDRINGMVTLVFLALLLLLFIDHTFTDLPLPVFLIVLMALTYPVFYFLVRFFFRRFSGSFLMPNLLSLGVQVSQLVSAFFILWALDIHSLYVEYLVLFLLSSMVAVLPFTIGGIGARELVFVFGANYLMIDKNAAVAFSLLFFILTAFSSLPGTFLELKLKNRSGQVS
ncbi:MAG: flippase-like domain-containing protein [Cyclobacteriaceae bacterium]|nr:flippase-like domain-containing protein [Cyclobacteriaceae bacterium]